MLKTDSLGPSTWILQAIKMNNISQFLLNKWDERMTNFGLKLHELTLSQNYHEHNAYFFLRRELEVTNNEEYVVAKREGRIRHCKPYCGRFLDYIANKEFKTLEAWVNDCGGYMTDVLYGTNRVHKFIWREGIRVSQRPEWVHLDTLLRRLDFFIVNNPEDEAEREVIDVEEILKREGLTLDNLWVIRDGTPVQWKSFIKV